MGSGSLCPICKRPLSEDGEYKAVRPFCSKRCADTDLLNWLKGAYALPAAEHEDGPDQAPEEELGEDESGPGDSQLRH